MKAQAINGVSNGAADLIEISLPQRYRVTIEGIAPILFHAWNVESVATKSAAAKNSRQKKTDDLETYVYRVSDVDRRLGVPGLAFHGALIEAGRYVADPRSPRKSARDLVKAGVLVDTLIAPFEPNTVEWDFVDRRRVTIQRAGITRERPAMRAGWRLSFDLTIGTPEYIDVTLLRGLIANAGRLIGLCDFRPSHGRFDLVGFTAL